MKFSTILVSGTLAFDDFTRTQHSEFCQLIGQTIVQVPSFRLLTGGMRVGGQGGVDYYTAQGARELLATPTLQRLKIHTRIPLGIAVEDSFRMGTVHQCNATTVEERRYSLIRQSDLVLTIGGGPGTMDLFYDAQDLNKPIIPLGFTGGASKQLWQHIPSRQWVIDMCHLTKPEQLFMDNEQYRFAEAIAVGKCILERFLENELPIIGN